MAHKIVESLEQSLLIRGFFDDMRDNFSGRPGAMGDGYIDVGVENLDLEF